MKIIFFGTPDFAVQPLKALMNAEHEVVAVVTQPDRRSGRGGHITSCPVKSEAKNAGLRIIQPDSIKRPGFITEIETLNPSAIVVVAFGQILPLEIINMPKYGCINIHASLLPKYRGAAPVNWAIINGEKTTGITTILMDEGVDTGPVLMQEKTEIKEDDDSSSLSKRLSKIGADTLIHTLKGLEDGSISPRTQEGNATYARMLRKSDGAVSWTGTAEELFNHVRGLSPWPGAYGFLDSERVKILKTVPAEGNGRPGVIEKITRDKLLVGTGRGLLSIVEIQPSGKPAMAVKAFLQGRKLSEGMRFNEQPVD